MTLIALIKDLCLCDYDLALALLKGREMNINGAFDYNEIDGQNLSRFTASTKPKATLSTYSHRGFVCAVPKQVNRGKMYF